MPSAVQAPCRWARWVRALIISAFPAIMWASTTLDYRLWRRRRRQRRLSFALRHVRASHQIRRSRPRLWQGAGRDGGTCGDRGGRCRHAAADAQGDFADLSAHYVTRVEASGRRRPRRGGTAEAAAGANAYDVAGDHTKPHASPARSRCRPSTSRRWMRRCHLEESADEYEAAANGNLSPRPEEEGCMAIMRIRRHASGRRPVCRDGTGTRT